VEQLEYHSWTRSIVVVVVLLLLLLLLLLLAACRPRPWKSSKTGGVDSTRHVHSKQRRRMQP
jgi:hypothetical protein